MKTATLSGLIEYAVENLRLIQTCKRQLANIVTQLRTQSAGTMLESGGPVWFVVKGYVVSVHDGVVTMQGEEHSLGELDGDDDCFDPSESAHVTADPKGGA